MLLSVSDLRVTFSTPTGAVAAVRGVSFNVERGKTLAIVGESGSGKTVATQALVGLVQGATISGRAVFEDRDLFTMPTRELRTIRGAGIGMVFQNPMSSFHPHFRIGSQIAEALRIHARANAHDARRRAIELLERTGIADASGRANDFPHEFSGGMLQRAMIAMAIACNPRLLIADEPTTALDATVQTQILALLRDLQSSLGMAMIIITHDLGVVSHIADDVVVMYAGSVMESAPRAALYGAPHHPYTNALLHALPDISAPRTKMESIRGQPPTPQAIPAGCPFNPRCDFTFAQCAAEQPPLVPVRDSDAHRSACWLPPDRASA